MERDTSTNDQQETRMRPLVASKNNSRLSAVGVGTIRNNIPSDSHNPRTMFHSNTITPVHPNQLLNDFKKVENATTLDRNLLLSRNEPLADALSSSLLTFAKNAPSPEQEAVGVDSSLSGSSSGDAAVGVKRRRYEKPLNDHNLSPSDRDSSNASGSNSRNIVTATQTTSSGDSGGLTSEHSSTEKLRPHHHHHHSSRRHRTNDNGSALQVPRVDGSDRLAGGPATVAASRLPTLNSSSDTGSSGDGEALLQPHQEPASHLSRRSFSRLPSRRRGGLKNSSAAAMETFSSEDTTRMTKRNKHGVPSLGRSSPSSDSINSNNPGGGGSSSGSGTEGGYAASASSNDLSSRQSSSSPSVSSSEEQSRRKTKSKRHHHRAHNKDALFKQQADGLGGSASSVIADFSSGSAFETGEEAGTFTINAFAESPSASPSLSSSNGEGSMDDLEESYRRAKRDAAKDHSMDQKRKAVEGAEWAEWSRHRMTRTTIDNIKQTPWSRPRLLRADDTNVKPPAKLQGQPPILSLGSDIMAHVLTFLQPPEILDVMTMPLSKDWGQNFTSQPELWRVLCLSEPFKAQIEDEEGSSTSESFCSYQDEQDGDRRLLDRYRLMYTSFVRCMKYLSQIREDAMNGRPPSYIDYGIGGSNVANTSSATMQPSLVGTNKSLQSFLARARGVVTESRRNQESSSAESSSFSEQTSPFASANTMPAISSSGQPKKVRKTVPILVLEESHAIYLLCLTVLFVLL
jgi:hypothetical protein